jgi:hypothetical protein
MRRLGANRMRSGRRAWAVRQYDPGSEANLILDLWAERGVTQAGTGVSSWVGQPGNLDFIQGTDADRPTYNATGLGGRPSVDFILANTDVLRLASGLSTASLNLTLISIGDLLSTAGTQYMMDVETGRLIFSPVRASNPHIFDGAWIDSGAASSTGAYFRAWRLDDTNNQFKFLRGHDQIGATGGFTGRAIGGKIGIGDGHSASEGPLNMRVARLMLFSNVDAERDHRVHHWAVSYYGVAH